MKKSITRLYGTDYFQKIKRNDAMGHEEQMTDNK